MTDLLAFSVVFGTSVWVLIDSRNIEIKQGSTKGFFNMGPTGWFLACLLCWIAAFPVYLIKRREHRLAVADGSERSSGRTVRAPAALPTPTSVPSLKPSPSSHRVGSSAPTSFERSDSHWPSASWNRRRRLTS